MSNLILIKQYRGAYHLKLSIPRVKYCTHCSIYCPCCAQYYTHCTKHYTYFICDFKTILLVYYSLLIFVYNLKTMNDRPIMCCMLLIQFCNTNRICRRQKIYAFLFDENEFFSNQYFEICGRTLYTCHKYAILQ